jgi:hypothetical protein
VRNLDLREPYPWQCPNCWNWTDFDIDYVFGACEYCDDTRLRWPWLRRLDAWWRSYRLGLWWRWTKRPRGLWERCCSCGRMERVLWLRVGDHGACIPF